MKVTCILVIFLCSIYAASSQNPPLEELPLTPHRDNPAFNRDRKKNLINKPEMPTRWINKHTQPFDPMWMDYCDPYHCKYYRNFACGLNRRQMKFKMFQSYCHLLLNNQCAIYRGNIKYDQIELKHCHAYMLFLRAGLNCPRECPDVVEPICGMSSIDGHTVIFENYCLMEAANCKNDTLQVYDQVYLEICEYSLLKALNLDKII